MSNTQTGHWVIDETNGNYNDPTSHRIGLYAPCQQVNHKVQGQIKTYLLINPLNYFNLNFDHKIINIKIQHVRHLPKIFRHRK